MVSIAYDLRYASDHFPGIGTHAYGLLTAWLALERETRFDVLWDPGLRNTRFDLTPVRSHRRVRWIEHRQAGASLLRWEPGSSLHRLGSAIYVSPFYVAPFGFAGPRLLTIHDVLPLARPAESGGWRGTLLKLVLSGAGRRSHFVTSSDWSAHEIRTYAGIDPARLHVVRPGVPPAGARAMQRPAGLPDVPFALVVGINKPHKNLETLIQAWAGWDAPTLAVAGPEDPRYPGVAALAARHGARPVVALGRVGEAELAWLYHHARLFVFPTCYEGFGFPLLEAMAAGRPAVVSDIPPLRELGASAPRYVSPADVEGWRTAIQALWNDAATLEAMSARSSERATRFDYRDTAASFDGLVAARLADRR